MLTIDKAIEILNNYLRGDEPDDPTKLPDAIRLSIEALKRVRGVENQYRSFQKWLLPGETEE